MTFHLFSLRFSLISISKCIKEGARKIERSATITARSVFIKTVPDLSKFMHQWALSGGGIWSIYETRFSLQFALNEQFSYYTTSHSIARAQFRYSVDSRRLTHLLYKLTLYAEVLGSNSKHWRHRTILEIRIQWMLWLRIWESSEVYLSKLVESFLRAFKSF